MFHTDRGSQYASELHRGILAKQGFFGSMSRLSNPHDNAKAESLMKTLRVEDAYLMEYESFDDVATGLPRFIEALQQPPSAFNLGLSQPCTVRRSPRPRHGHNRCLKMSIRRGTLQGNCMGQSFRF